MLKMKYVITDKEFADMIDSVVKELLDTTQPGGGWFEGDKEKFDEWAGDVLWDALEKCLNYFDIIIHD